MNDAQFEKLQRLGCKMFGRTVEIRGQLYPKWRCVELARCMPLPNVETLIRGLSNMPPISQSGIKTVRTEISEFRPAQSDMAMSAANAAIPTNAEQLELIDW